MYVPIELTIQLPVSYIRQECVLLQQHTTQQCARAHRLSIRRISSVVWWSCWQQHTLLTHQDMILYTKLIFAYILTSIIALLSNHHLVTFDHQIDRDLRGVTSYTLFELSPSYICSTALCGFMGELEPTALTIRSSDHPIIQSINLITLNPS